MVQYEKQPVRDKKKKCMRHKSKSKTMNFKDSSVSTAPSTDIGQLHPESKAASYQFLHHCRPSYYVDTTKLLEHLK